MIKINLLNSVTDRQGGAMVAVDRKISSAASRFVLMSVAVFVLMAAVIVDSVTRRARAAHGRA